MKKMGKLSIGWRIILFLLPIVTALIALGIGRIWISPAEVTYWLMGGLNNAGYKNLFFGAQLIILGILMEKGILSKGEGYD